VTRKRYTRFWIIFFLVFIALAIAAQALGM